MSIRPRSVALSAAVLLLTACGATPTAAPVPTPTTHRETENATSGLIPLDQIDVTDDTAYHTQLGLRFNTPLRGEYVALLEKRLAAIPTDEAAARELARVLDAAQQWDRALEVLRQFESIRDGAQRGTTRVQISHDATSTLARQIAAHGNPSEWRARLVRDRVADDGEVAATMGNIAALLELEPGEYRECETMVLMDQDMRGLTSSTPLTHISPPVRIAKNLFLRALNTYMWTRAESLKRLPNDAIALRVYATGLALGMTSDDGHAHGIWSFADGSERVLELAALGGDQRMLNTTWVDRVRAGSVEITFALRDHELETYRPIGRLQAELTADEFVVTDVSRELLAVLAEFARYAP